jgi:hypothetical protein
MKKLIPTISKMAMGGEPPKGVKPIYVSDKNDPRFKSYQDSLYYYTKYPPPSKSVKTEPYNWKTSYVNSGSFNKEGIPISIPMTQSTRPKIEPLGYYNNNKNKKVSYKKDIKNNNEQIQNNVSTAYYKKPVQPVEYRQAVTPTIVPKPKVTPKPVFKTTPKPVVSTKKIQMETTKLDTVPVVQPTIATPPTPLTKKQYYEVPDANGKNVLLTPEQFSRMSSGNKNDLMSKSPIMNKPKYFYEMNSSGKRQLIPENKIREYMQTKNK